jgi:hypothetical protein
MSIGARSAIVWLMISHSSYPHRDLAGAPHLIFRFLETSRASPRATAKPVRIMDWRLSRRMNRPGRA